MNRIFFIQKFWLFKSIQLWWRLGPCCFFLWQSDFLERFGSQVHWSRTCDTEGHWRWGNGFFSKKWRGWSVGKLWWCEDIAWFSPTRSKQKSTRRPDFFWRRSRTWNWTSPFPKVCFFLIHSFIKKSRPKRWWGWMLSVDVILQNWINVQLQKKKWIAKTICTVLKMYYFKWKMTKKRISKCHLNLQEGNFRSSSPSLEARNWRLRGAAEISTQITDGSLEILHKMLL